MGLADLEYNDGQTPLDEDEKDGLLNTVVTTRAELDELEQHNIQKAMYWVATRRKAFTIQEVLSEAFVKELHKKMYGEVWAWAGEFRKSNKNIGVDKYQIVVDLKNLLDDCHYWIANASFPNDEIAIRFKHRLVSIHCFPNGNGRHSRLMADILAEKLFGTAVFSWGGQNLVAEGDTRTAYLQAIWQADAALYEPLMAFARS